jgi:hypothetical protein
MPDLDRLYAGGKSMSAGDRTCREAEIAAPFAATLVFEIQGDDGVLPRADRARQLRSEDNLNAIHDHSDDHWR